MLTARYEAWVVAYLVVVNSALVFIDKVLDEIVSSDCGRTADGFSEMGVDRGAGDGLHSFHLASSGHVKSLNKVVAKSNGDYNCQK